MPETQQNESQPNLDEPSVFTDAGEINALVKEVAILEFKAMFKKVNSQFHARFENHLREKHRLETTTDQVASLAKQKIKESIVSIETKF